MSEPRHEALVCCELLTSRLAQHSSQSSRHRGKAAPTSEETRNCSLVIDRETNRVVEKNITLPSMRLS